MEESAGAADDGTLVQMMMKAMHSKARILMASLPIG
jgi:hypothetical protein